MIQAALAEAVRGRELPPHLASGAMQCMMRGEATESQIGGLLSALRTRGETASELAAFARTMEEFSVRVRPAISGPLVDTCGTGGDGMATFNISTCAALVAAGAGVAVAKHGNRAVSSQCGSGDVLEALGAKLTLDPETASRTLAEAGIVYLHAPDHHPALRHAAGVRRELGIRTVFNLLGPLLNPAGATAQLLGVYDPALVVPVAEALATLGRDRAFVVHGGGLDELTTTGESSVAVLDNGQVRTMTVAPEEFGLARASCADLAGGGPTENARILLRVLSGEEGAARDIVLLNAAAACVLGGRGSHLAAGLTAAETAIESGASLDRLERLVRATGGEPCFSTR